MKKVLVLLAALVMLAVCSACSDNKGSSSSGNSPSADHAITEQPSPSAEADLPELPIPSVSSVDAGDVIPFGHYEQDNNPGNGPEPIEWLVLDIQDGKALLLSKYGLEAKAYNTKFVDITWENCTLRTWLNGEFLAKTFSAKEQSAILLTEVDNSDAQGFDWSIQTGEKNTTGGNNTEDRIFLLSYAEANRYLDVQYKQSNDNIKSRVAPTEYAIQNGAFVNDRTKTEEGGSSGDWWLRSPGTHQNYTTAVLSNGMLWCGAVYADIGIVRPALWLVLNSGN